MKKYSLVLILAVVFFTGCGDDFFDQVVDVDIPEHTPALAVTSNLANSDEILLVYVTSSIGILDKDEPAEISDAVVEIFKDGELFSTPAYAEQGFYFQELSAPLGNDVNSEFELRVAKDGFESVSSIQRMPVQIDIDKVTFEKDGTIDEEGDRVDELVIEFTDEKDVANYYKVSIDMEYTYSDGSTYTARNRYFNSNDLYTTDTNDGIYVTDAIFDGGEYELRLWTYDLYIDPNVESAKMLVSLTNLSKDRYFRETSIEAYQNSEDNPFAEPAVIYSNIENGYGIFSLEARGPKFVLEF